MNTTFHLILDSREWNHSNQSQRVGGVTCSPDIVSLLVFQTEALRGLQARSVLTLRVGFLRIIRLITKPREKLGFRWKRVATAQTLVLEKLYARRVWVTKPLRRETKRGIVDLNIGGILVIVGNYGSGKTEVSVNLAVNRRRAGMKVRVADLDLVNPYFRTREAEKALNSLGIDLIAPDDHFLQADLPILSPMVAGLIRKPEELTLLDVGGDNVGATVLAALADAFAKSQGTMLQVVNPFRPFTDTPDGCERIRKEIEAASQLQTEGLIGNANLIDQTTVDTIKQGYDFMRELSQRNGLPLRFITAPAHLLDSLNADDFEHPILPIERQLVPPWTAPAKLGPKNFILH